jgi:hypothetical protein
VKNRSKRKINLLIHEAKEKIHPPEIALLSEIIAKDPSNSELFLQRAIEYMAQDSKDEAVR